MANGGRWNALSDSVLNRLLQPSRLEANSVKIVKILLVGAGIILVAALLVVSGRAAKIPEQEATGP